jgi:acyl-coenzyme A synthetase/AMP-(fatty) acid ligase
MAETGLPVISDHRPARPFAWRRGESIPQSEALAKIRILARELESDRPYINLCEDRYRFTLAFAAVCLARSTNLLPQSGSEGILNNLREDYPGARVLDDGRITEYLARPSRQPTPTDVPRIDADHLAAIVFTSGSTGRPNPQHKYWQGLQTGTGLCLRRFFTRQRTANIVATVPPQHMYGLETSVLTALQGGLAAHADRPFMPWDVARTLAEIAPPRVLVTTPVHLRACLEAGIEMPAIGMILSATAPLSRDLARSAEKTWTTEVREIYGCTEAGSLASRRTAEDPVWTLYDGMRLQRRGDDLYLHGPQLAQAVPLNDDLELLDERHFHLLGRSADMIKLAGKRLSLGDLTQQLLAIDGVRDAAVFIPGEGQRPAALVVAPRLQPREIAALLADRIDPVFVPRPLVRVARLPRNAVGKLPRTELESLLQRARQNRLPA